MREGQPTHFHSDSTPKEEKGMLADLVHKLHEAEREGPIAEPLPVGFVRRFQESLEGSPRPLANYLRHLDPAQLAEGLHFTNGNRTADVRGLEGLMLDERGRLVLHGTILMEWKDGSPHLETLYQGPWQEAAH